LIYGGCGVRKGCVNADVVVIIRRTHHEPGRVPLHVLGVGVILGPSMV
jgi:hypothetical protein